MHFSKVFVPFALVALKASGVQAAGGTPSPSGVQATGDLGSPRGMGTAGDLGSPRSGQAADGFPSSPGSSGPVAPVGPPKSSRRGRLNVFRDRRGGKKASKMCQTSLLFSYGGVVRTMSLVPGEVNDFWYPYGLYQEERMIKVKPNAWTCKPSVQGEIPTKWRWEWKMV
ncbi:hypothetical protein PspLS_09229 [Pyricularia sp. CBS 133598]|nr:hypothetical protein PspLS_09229 [Pyricularia sp. CBS 133598]